MITYKFGNVEDLASYVESDGFHGRGRPRNPTNDRQRHVLWGYKEACKDIAETLRKSNLRSSDFVDAVEEQMRTVRRLEDFIRVVRDWQDGDSKESGDNGEEEQD